MLRGLEACGNNALLKEQFYWALSASARVPGGAVSRCARRAGRTHPGLWEGSPQDLRFRRGVTLFQAQESGDAIDSPQIEATLFLEAMNLKHFRASLSAPIVVVTGRFLLLATMASLFAVRAGAGVPQNKPASDVIVFANGDQLTGTLLRGVGDTVVFRSEMAGEITVPLSKVRELRSNERFAVLRKGEHPIRTSKQTGTLTFADQKVSVAISPSVVETVPVTELAFMVETSIYEKELNPHPGVWYGWNGSVTGGATILRSTNTGSTYTAGISLVRAIPTVPYLPARNRTIFNLFETYGQLTQPVIPQPASPALPVPDQVAKTNIFHGDLERDEYFTQRFYGLVQAAFDHNYAQGLTLQQVYGAGFGWTIVQTPLQQFDVKASIDYEQQKRASTTSLNLVGASFGENYRRTLPKKIAFTEYGTFVPAFNIANAYSANFSAGLVLPVYKRLGASLGVSDNYLNNPAVGYRKNSFQFVTGVTYSIR